MIDKKTHWNTGGVSVTGFSHLENGIPCQDAYTLAVTANGMFVAAVADGAGSARLSHFGSTAFAEAVISTLQSYPADKILSDEEYIRCRVISAIELAKEQLLMDFPRVFTETEYGMISIPTTIRDFHSTLVAVIADGTGGAFIHVGDGVGTAFPITNLTASIVSKPENGEYSNETFFVTQDDWEDHLRITPFPQDYNSIFLMSDGVSGMAMTKGCEEPFEKFMRPLVNFICDNVRENSEIALRNSLSKDTVKSITGDDKTLVWGTREDSDPTNR